MSFTRLQYESLKTVLQYMEANKRFCLSKSIPDIYFAEKAVPLRIRYIDFGDLRFRVNKTSYFLSIYRDFHQGEKILDPFQRENNDGSLVDDLDQYGFRVPFNRTDVAPGEVVFDDLNDVNNHFMPSPPTFPWASEQGNERLRRFYERHLEIYQIALARRSEGGQGFPFPMMTIVFTYDELLAMRGRIIQELTPEALELKLAALNQMSTCTLKTFIAKLRYCLQPFDCRQNNKALPFTPLIQLTIKSEDGQEKRIERYPYTFKLHEAMRKLCGKLFGGRKSIVQVHKFSLNNINMVFRIPEGFNIRVRNLRLGETRIKRLEALKNLIHESSYPLASLIIHGRGYEVDHFAHSALTSARQLILEGAFPGDITYLLNLKNTIVCCKYSWSRELSNEELLAFAENIVTTVFPIGTYRSFKISQEGRIKNLLNQVRERFNGRTKQSSISIAMGNDSKLKIFYKTDPSRQEPKKWLVIMNVVPDRQNASH